MGIGTILVAIVLVVIVALAIRSAVKELKHGGCAYCSGCAVHPSKDAENEMKAASACDGNCSHCSRSCH